MNFSACMNERKPLIELFLEINSQLNLSAIRDEEGVYTKHIMDSLELTQVLDLSQYGTLCDVGTGGGFPLLTLSKYKNDNSFQLQLTGLDARRKKIDAINQMIEKL